MCSAGIYHLLLEPAGLQVWVVLHMHAPDVGTIRYSSSKKMIGFWGKIRQKTVLSVGFRAVLPLDVSRIC